MDTLFEVLINNCYFWKIFERLYLSCRFDIIN